MDYELIFLRHQNGISSFTFAEYPAIECRCPINLESTDTVDDAIEKVRFALQVMVDDNDVDYEAIVLNACPFGHLSLPNVLFKIDRQAVSTHLECKKSVADRQAKNRNVTNMLLVSTLGTLEGNLHQTIARTSITDVVEASFCDIVDFVTAFDWLQCESAALWLYLRSIDN